MGASSNFGSNLTSELRVGAGWGIFFGIVTAALGVLLIVYPLFAATVTTIFIGCILLIFGIVDIALALRAHKAGTFLLKLLLGVVYCFGGLLLLFNPQWGVAVLMVVLDVMLLFEAGAATALAFQVKPLSGWGWLLFNAVITAILGLWILAHRPASAAWAIGTLVGAAILVVGITRIALSARLRHVTARIEDKDTRPPCAA